MPLAALQNSKPRRTYVRQVRHNFRQASTGTGTKRKTTGKSGPQETTQTGKTNHALHRRRRSRGIFAGRCARYARGRGCTGTRRNPRAGRDFRTGKLHKKGLESFMSKMLEEWAQLLRTPREIQ